MMRTTLILVGTIALTAASAAAAAQGLPREFQGTWCAVGDDYVRSTKPCDVHETEMRVTARGFEIVDGECTALKAAQRGPGYRFKFKCSGEGGSPLITEQIWQIEKDKLQVKASASGGSVKMPGLIADQARENWCEEQVSSDANGTAFGFTARSEDGRCLVREAQPSSFWIENNRFGWGEDSVCTPTRVSKMRVLPDREQEWTITARCLDRDTRKPSARTMKFIFVVFKRTLDSITVLHAGR